jgi:hypothetical protein
LVVTLDKGLADVDPHNLLDEGDQLLAHKTCTRESACRTFARAACPTWSTREIKNRARVFSQGDSFADGLGSPGSKASSALVQKPWISPLSLRSGTFLDVREVLKISSIRVEMVLVSLCHVASMAVAVAVNMVMMMVVSWTARGGVVVG